MKARNFFLIVIVILLCGSCQHKPDQAQPVISFDSYKVPDGFEIQLIASEPLIEAPVVMDFDNQGRIWIVEMRGYMPNLAGTGEDAPSGRISILEDMDQNGRARHSKIFLDSLVLPRAIAHVYGGLLYSSHPNLSFVDINNDKPGKKILVDSLYSDGGNVESQPNALMMNIDNWIYNAHSNFRYQRKNGKWLKEPTSFRGQWGMSKDNFGRLYFNSNEIQIAGDFVLPNTVINNPYLKPKESINKILTDNQRVYPLHPTTVNRGSEKGILNKDSLLVKVTAACGPLIYRGDQFPAEYQLNAFICEPQGNLVKRNILQFESLKTTARQAYDDKEFMASTDEGFRPVNLLNAPDGSIYVVDMHRGIMQHRAFATPYYRNGIAHKELDTLISAGRILRIKNKNKKLSKIPPLLQATSRELVSLLKSSNGWVRDRAQQLIIFKQDKSIINDLQALAQDDKNEIPAIHALHTLQGLDGLSFDFLYKIAHLKGSPMLTAHALLLLEKYSSKEYIAPMAELASQLMVQPDTVVNLYLALSLNKWIQQSKDTFLPILASLSRQYAGNAVYQEAVVSSLNGLEKSFQTLISKDTANYTDTILTKMLSAAIQNRREKKMNSIFLNVSVQVDVRTAGLEIYRSTCMACHGADGEGIENVAPPLKGSQYVEGRPERLAMIVLNGLKGPLEINGHSYTFNGSMPNFGNNFSDQQIAEVIHYLHNSFVSGKSTSINAEKIKSLRNRHSGTLTEKDLINMENLK